LPDLAAGSTPARGTISFPNHYFVVVPRRLPFFAALSDIAGMQIRKESGAIGYTVAGFGRRFDSCSGHHFFDQLSGIFDLCCLIESGAAIPSINL